MITRLIASFRSRFRDERQYRLFGMMVLASACVFILVLARLYFKRAQLPEWSEFFSVKARGWTYAFLIWNLFLAWAPYVAALQAERLQRLGASWWPIGFWLSIWLAFLPNAPYIITDLQHLRPLMPVPFWFDIVLLFGTAGTGLLLGLLSLYEVHHILRRILSERWSWLLLLLAMGLSGFGVWLGRFQRWNSWDLVTRPEAVLRDIFQVVIHKNPHAFGVTVLLAGVMLVGYGMLSVMLAQQEQNK